MEKGSTSCVRKEDGEHRRIKRARNGSKMEKMDLHEKTTRPGLPHTGVSYDHVPLDRSKHNLHG
ncbi:hypothetical protein F383_36774 [Gossypium arboreum]|uniref:Uncharacterized protein n=1 Tax=Gossypium arboreum TaxID=29729 RepID=A0A0B0MEK3_GOSAR|nr:hypothetical protein F383_36774 [Gossypium arboreum]